MGVVEEKKPVSIHLMDWLLDLGTQRTWVSHQEAELIPARV